LQPFFDFDKMKQNFLSARNKFYRIPSVNTPYFYHLFCQLLDWRRKYNYSLFSVNIWRDVNHGARRIFFDIGFYRLYQYCHPYREVTTEKQPYPFPSGENPPLHDWQTYVAKYP